jgi:hypothetical protein
VLWHEPGIALQAVGDQRTQRQLDLLDARVGLTQRRGEIEALLDQQLLDRTEDRLPALVKEGLEFLGAELCSRWRPSRQAQDSLINIHQSRCKS